MRKVFDYIFSVIVLLFCCFLIGLCLSGCSRKTPVENAFHEVETSIVAIKESLPPECQTVEVMAKINEVEWKRQTAESVCQAKIKDTQNKYERVLWVLGFIILTLFAKIFTKK